MDKVDQFESVFRAAAKPVFHYTPPSLSRGLLVTDLPADRAAAFADAVRRYLAALGDAWTLEHVDGTAFRNVGELLETVERHDPGFVATYRHLHSDAWRWPYSLGEYLAVLTQFAPYPVLVLPHPKRAENEAVAMENTDVVMAMTDHLTGDDRLVNHATAFAAADGKLLLAHVEDEATFDRYVAIIAKIPEIDTDTATEKIRSRLLKEPGDFIESVRMVLASARPSLDVEGVVTLGHHLNEYMRLVHENAVDLLVMNTKDEDQLAMHGLAHPIAVELRTVPILML